MLFRSLLDEGLVDTVELAVIPVLLGSGIPLLPPGGTKKLVLADQKTLSTSGIVVLSYSVPGGAGPARIRYIKSKPRTKSPQVGKSLSTLRPRPSTKRGARSPKRRAG